MFCTMSTVLSSVTAGCTLPKSIGVVQQPGQLLNKRGITAWKCETDIRHWIRFMTSQEVNSVFSRHITNPTRKHYCVQLWSDSADSCKSQERQCSPSQIAGRSHLSEWERGNFGPGCSHRLCWLECLELEIQMTLYTNHICSHGIVMIAEAGHHAASRCRAGRCVSRTSWPMRTKVSSSVHQ